VADTLGVAALGASVVGIGATIAALSIPPVRSNRFAVPAALSLVAPAPAMAATYYLYGNKPAKSPGRIDIREFAHPMSGGMSVIGGIAGGIGAMMAFPMAFEEGRPQFFIPAGIFVGSWAIMGGAAAIRHAQKN
jgi:hypothetical protein